MFHCITSYVTQPPMGTKVISDCGIKMKFVKPCQDLYEIDGGLLCDICRFTGFDNVEELNKDFNTFWFEGEPIKLFGIKFLNKLLKIKHDYRNYNYSQCVTKLIGLIISANLWGNKNNWPNFEEYPYYEDIRRIGQRLYELGGLRIMQSAFYEVLPYLPPPRMSEHWWHHLGGDKGVWLA